MDNIVSKLTEIEEAAVSIVRHTEIQKQEYEQQIEQKRLDFDKELSLKTEERISAIKAKQEHSLEQKLSLQRSQSEQNIKAFEEEYELYHEQIAAQIIRRMTEV